MYTVVCSDLCEVIKGEKLLLDINRAVQAEITKQVPDSKNISVPRKIVDILSKVTPDMVKEVQEENINFRKTICYDKFDKKPILAQIYKIKSIPVHRYHHQFDTTGVSSGSTAHRVYEQDGAKYHQLILPIVFRAQVMELPHDEQGHQAVEQMLQLV